MKISSIKQQVKNPERASIFIDGKYSFSLSLDELVTEKLKNGQEIDEPSLRRLKKLSEDGKLRMRALEWAMSRPRSVREFKNYMFRKKADPENIDKLIEEFIAKGYLNEIVFAIWMIDVRRRRGKSERAIRSELASKGISYEIVQEAMQDSGDEEKRLKEVIIKKSSLQRYKADPQKLVQYLARQGFGYDKIKQAMQEARDSLS